MNPVERLILPHVNALYAMAFHLCGDRDAAEDMVQDTLVKAADSLSGLRNPEKAKSWLFSILYRRFVDEWRRARKTVEYVDDAHTPTGNDDERLWPHDVTPEQARKAMERLDDRYRAPLVAHYLSGQSYQEIAETMGLPLGTVMSRIHRAKRALREELSAPAQPLRALKGGRYGM